MKTKFYTGLASKTCKQDRTKRGPKVQEFSTTKANVNSNITIFNMKKQQISVSELKDIQQIALLNQIIEDVDTINLMEIISLDYSATLTAKQLMLQAIQNQSQASLILQERTKKLIRVLEYPLKQKRVKKSTLTNQRDIYPQKKQSIQFCQNYKQTVMNQPYYQGLKNRKQKDQIRPITQLNRCEYFLEPKNKSFDQDLIRKQRASECQQKQLSQNIDEQMIQNPNCAKMYCHKRSRTDNLPISNKSSINQYIRRAPKVQKIVLKSKRTQKMQQKSTKQEMFQQLRKQFSSICYNSQFSVQEKKVQSELKQLQIQLQGIANNSTPRIINQHQEQISKNINKFQNSQISQQSLCHQKRVQGQSESGPVKTVRVSLTPPRNKYSNKNTKKATLQTNKQDNKYKHQSNKPKLLSCRIDRALRC